MKSKPVTTLFMIQSLDGKISTGNSDARDIDADFPKLKGIKEGLPQYYDIEQTTDLHSFNTGKVQAKIGVNKKRDNVKKTDVSFIIIDNKPHLNNIGVDYFIKRSKTFYLVTTNKRHPAFKRQSEDNLEIIYYPRKINFPDLFNKFKVEYKINRITIQSGGTLNSVLLRENLIDHVSIVIAPALIGGENTPTLIDGKSLISKNDLKHIKALKFKKCDILKHSYISLKYDVIN